MSSIIATWASLPGAIVNYLGDWQVWVFLLIGVAVGYFVGVMPGLGPTMGMALALGIVYKLPTHVGLALLCGMFVASVGSGGITASLINIPGTSAAAATCMDGYALAKQGKGREACGYSIFASVIGTILAVIFIFLIQPFVTSIALKFGDWETFLFCLFGLLICGSLSGDQPIKGWISALLGFFLAMCGAESVQSVVRYNLGVSDLLGGFNTVVAMLGLFGIGEVLYTLRHKESFKTDGKGGFPIIKIPVFIKNIGNVIRSALAGIWIGFIPGIGESAACWFSYDLAKRSSKKPEKFGKGSSEGMIAAETANNASSIGALIPALALGIPGSSTVAIFISALFLMNYRPGPTLVMQTPDILSGICILLFVAALGLLLFGFLASRITLKLLSIPESVLMPLIAVFCTVGAYGTTNTPFALIQLAFFGVLGLVLKIYNFPIPPLVLGLLVGKTADTCLRRAFLQYSSEIGKLFLRPFGLCVMAALILVLVLSIVSDRKSKKAMAEIKEAAEEENQ